MHLVDTNLFWGGVYLVQLLRFAMQPVEADFDDTPIPMPNADRIVHCGRLYHSGNEERRRSHRRLITRARRRAEFDLYAATDAPLW